MFTHTRARRERPFTQYDMDGGGELRAFTTSSSAGGGGGRRLLLPLTRAAHTATQQLTTTTAALTALRDEHVALRDLHARTAAALEAAEAERGVAVAALQEQLREARARADELAEFRDGAGEMRGLRVAGERMAAELKEAREELERVHAENRERQLTESALRRKLHIMVESNELKQKIIQEFETKVTHDAAHEFDAHQVAVLREFQAHRLQSLFEKSRKHLDLERKHNEVLRRSLTESQNVTLIEGMRSEIAMLKDELRDVRKENVALKGIRVHQERQILQLSEDKQKLQEESHEAEMALLRDKIAALEGLRSRSTAH